MVKDEKKHRVLVVDDEAAILRFVRASLKAFGYDVVTTSNSGEVFELIESEKPDILLLDLLMPVKNGFEVLQELRARSRLPVIAFSARTSLGEEALHLGANDFVGKPFTPQQVEQRIRAILGSRGNGGAGQLN